MAVSEFRIDGMTCDHCARAVSAEVGALPGVTEVAVDVPRGRVRVTAKAALSDSEVAAAVDEAGYAFAGRL